tara:strand:- start:124386 stop:124775 length:390 start_codon:yes stop_codon:yes gene_type:complete
LLVLPLQAVSAADKAAGPQSLFTGSYILQVIGSLLIVFGCIFGLLYLLKKLNGLPMSGNSPIRVLASAKVGAREKVVLLQAGEQQLLVGVAAGSIRTLLVLDEPLPDLGSAGQSAQFASLLQSASSGQR